MEKHNLSKSNKKELASLWYARAMEQLVEVVQLLSLARDLQAIMNIVRHAARKLTGADGATFILRDNDKCFYAEEDAISPLWKGQRFPMSACISGWVMLNKQPAIIEDIYADQRIPANIYRPTFVKSLAMVPIRTIDPIGAIGNYWATQHLPTPEQIKILQVLADTTAVAMENVSVYENMEKCVQQRTEELQSILDNVQAAIVFAMDDKIIRANPKAAEIFGYPSAETMLAETLPTLLRNADSGDSLVEAAKADFFKNEVFSTESRIVRQDAETFWVRLVAKSLNTGNSSHSEIWVVSDISERKQREQVLNDLKLAAENANRAKDSFLATMSHEIRTPLTGMLGMLELLSMTALDQEQRSTLEAAWDSGRGLLRIVSDILDWSKIEEGKLELSLSPTSIRQLLQEVVNTYSRVASAKSLLLQHQIDARLSASYIVDPLRLSQVLNNFVSNAIKFTQHGKIEVRAELIERHETGEKIRFSVRDTGISITKDVQQHLFTRYRQGSADTARMYGGTGLGLSICRRLADLMDGQIDVKSEEGLGSTFSITLNLPVSDLPAETVRSRHLEVKQREVKPLIPAGMPAPLALAVDDHPVSRNLLERQLKLLGLQTETAENGKDAFAKWQRSEFSLIITDCHMPEMDGYQLARKIRQAEGAQNHIPIIAWTANALVEETEYCHAAGIDDVLVKPTTLGQLRATLAKCLFPNGEEETPLSVETDAPQQVGPIDYNVLDAVVTNRADQAHILRDFHSYIQAEYIQLAGLLDTGKREDLKALAHRIKGSCRMVGARRLAAACEAIELNAKACNIQQLKAFQMELNDALRQFGEALDGLHT